MSSEKSNNKKIITIAIAVAVFLFLVLGGYFLAVSGEKNNSTDNQSQSNTYQDTQSDKTDSSNKEASNNNSSYIGSTIYGQSFYTYQTGSNSGNSNNSNSDNSNNKPTAYSVTVNIPTGFKSITATPMTAKAGETIRLAYELQPNCYFSSWTVKDSSGNAVSVRNNSFKMPACNVTVCAKAITQEFSFTVNTENASTPGYFYIPTSGMNGNGVKNTWNIDWGDGGDIEEATVTSSTSSAGVEHQYIDPSKNYTITITPHDPTETAWMTAFGFYRNADGTANAQTNKDCVESVNSPLLWQMTRSSIDEAPDYEYAYMFSGCRKLASLSGLNLPQNINSVGECFCSYMFYNCASLETLSSDFNLPQSKNFTSVKASFCAYMFSGCTSLTSFPDKFNLPQSVSSVDADFCIGMLGRCNSLTSLPPGFNLPQNITSYGDSFCDSMFYKCTSLISLPGGFILPRGITSVGTYFCRNMFAGCSSLISLPDGFNLPQGIASVGDYFCYYMFSKCTSLISLPDGFNLPQDINSATEGFCQDMFYCCTSLISLPDGFNLPQNIGSVSDAFCKDMFNGCGSLKSLPKTFAVPQGIISFGESFCSCMFRECGSLQINKGFTLPYTTAKEAYYYMFYNCTAQQKEGMLIEDIIKPWITAGAEPSTKLHTFTNTKFDDYDQMKSAHGNWF